MQCTFAMLRRELADQLDCKTTFFSFKFATDAKSLEEARRVQKKDTPF